MAALDNAALASEVSNLKEGHAALRGDFRDLKSSVDNGFAQMGQNLDVRLDRMANALLAKTTTNWQPIGIAVSCLTAVGLAIAAALYYPLRETMQKQEIQIEGVRRDAAERERVAEGRIVKLWDDHNKTVRDLSYLQGQMHPLPR